MSTTCTEVRFCAMSSARTDLALVMTVLDVEDRRGASSISGSVAVCPSSEDAVITLLCLLLLNLRRDLMREPPCRMRALSPLELAWEVEQPSSIELCEPLVPSR